MVSWPRVALISRKISSYVHQPFLLEQFRGARFDVLMSDASARERARASEREREGGRTKGRERLILLMLLKFGVLKRRGKEINAYREIEKICVSMKTNNIKINKLCI